jgi:hypothetical protein
VFSPCCYVATYLGTSTAGSSQPQPPMHRAGIGLAMGIAHRTQRTQPAATATSWLPALLLLAARCSALALGS